MNVFLTKRIVYLSIACAVVVGLAVEVLNINLPSEQATKPSTQLEYLAGPHDIPGG